MSTSTDDFIKAIYQIKDHGEKASSTALANWLQISNAAITDMAKKLSARGLVKYEKYKELSLTKHGKDAALKVIRKHRLWETFLHKVLKLSSSEIHHEAELLEHQTSEFLLGKIDNFLEHPEFDPHGDPIPDAALQFPSLRNQIVLTNARPGQYIIIRILPLQPDHDAFFRQNQIQKGSEIGLLMQFKDDEAQLVEIEDRKIVLTRNLSKKIYVIKKT